MNVAQAATAALSISKSISCIFGPPRPFRPSRASGLRSHFVAVLAPRSASRNLLFGPPPAFRAVAGFGLAVPFRGVLSPRGFAPSLGLTSFLHRISVLPSVAARFPVPFLFYHEKTPAAARYAIIHPSWSFTSSIAGPPDWGFPPARRSSPSAAPPARRLPRSDRRCPDGSRRIGQWRRSGCPPAAPASGPAGR